MERLFETTSKKDWVESRWVIFRGVSKVGF